MKILEKKGQISVMQCIYITDTSGNALTGITFDEGGLSAYYYRPGHLTTPTQITLIDMTLGSYSSGGFKEVHSTQVPGLYEIHLPNAVFADGANFAYVIYYGAVSMAPVPIEIELVDSRVFLPWVRRT